MSTTMCPRAVVAAAATAVVAAVGDAVAAAAVTVTVAAAAVTVAVVAATVGVKVRSMPAVNRKLQGEQPPITATTFGSIRTLTTEAIR